MPDDTANKAIAILMAIRERDGAEAVVQAAKQMIAAATVFISREQGSDEARRFLRIVGEAQGQPGA
jgi:hypothetical protein